MVGLDAAGKTTILYKLKLGEGKLAHVTKVSWLLPSGLAPASYGIAHLTVNIFSTCA